MEIMLEKIEVGVDVKCEDCLLGQLIYDVLINRLFVERKKFLLINFVNFLCFLYDVIIDFIKDLF